MGLKDKLSTDGSVLSEFDGTQIPQMPGANNSSTLHYEYSINGQPTMVNKPTPSLLDLDGLTPPRYLDNLPG